MGGHTQSLGGARLPRSDGTGVIPKLNAET